MKFAKTSILVTEPNILSTIGSELNNKIIFKEIRRRTDNKKHSTIQHFQMIFRRKMFISLHLCNHQIVWVIVVLSGISIECIFKLSKH